jgi:hypothetical protein
VTAGNKTFRERMTIAKFIRFSRQTEKPIKIGGTTIKLEGNPESEKQIRDYFKQVAQAYMLAVWGKNPERN